MEILLIYAISWEIRPLLRALRSRGALVSGHGIPEKISYGRMRITLRSLGMGAERAGRNLQTALATCKPDMVFLAGFSGAAHAGQQAGDIALPKVITNSDNKKGLQEDIFAPINSIPAGMFAALEDLLRQKGCRVSQESRAVVVSSLLGPGKKAQIGKRWADACGVDMESYAVVRLCAERGIPLLCVRAIFDEMHQVLPAIGNLWSRFWELPWWYLRYRHVAAQLSLATQCALDLCARKDFVAGATRFR